MAGTIRLRKDGRWEGRVVIGYDEGGNPKTKNVLAKTKKECTESQGITFSPFSKVKLSISGLETEAQINEPSNNVRQPMESMGTSHFAMIVLTNDCRPSSTRKATVFRSPHRSQ